MPDADASGYADRRASKTGCRVPGERTRGAAQAAGCLRVAAILRNLAVIANLWLPAASGNAARTELPARGTVASRPIRFLKSPPARRRGEPDPMPDANAAAA